MAPNSDCKTRDIDLGEKTRHRVGGVSSAVHPAHQGRELHTLTARQPPKDKEQLPLEVSLWAAAASLDSCSSTAGPLLGLASPLLGGML